MAFADDFNRANGPLAGTNGWLAHPTTVDAHLISSARVLCPVSQAVTYAAPDVGSADYRISVDLINPAVSQPTNYYGILARASSSVLSGYHARWNSGNVQLYSVVGGTLTQLGGNVAKTLPQHENHKLALVCEGNQISVEWDGVSVIGPVTNSAHSGEGVIILRSGSSLALFDNLLVEAIGGSPPAGTVTIGTITPTSDGASVAFTYDDTDQTGYKYRIDGGTALSAGTSSPLVITGQSPGTYSVEICATNADGDGAWSDAEGYTVAAATGINPGAGTITITGYAPAVAQTGGASLTPGAGSLSITGYAPTIARTTLGTIVTPVLKNNTGTVLANETGVVVNVYHSTTGALVLQKTGLTSSALGVVTVTDDALEAGTTYAYEVVLSSNGRRLPTAEAA